MTEPMIGHARVRDAEMILKLQYLCYQSEAALYDDYMLPPLIQTLPDLLRQYDTHTILVARVGEEVVASVRGELQGETASIGRLCVHPRFQRRGLGTRLMNAIEDELRVASRYELFTGHRSADNIRLYHTLGYEIMSERGQLSGPRLVFMQKIRK